MKLRLPDTIEVGYRSYTVKEMPDSTSIGDGRFGDNNSAYAEIGVNMGCGPQKAACTLLHELFHAIFKEYNIEDEDKDKEERVVTTMANGLSSVMRANPDLMGRIQKALR